MKKNIKDMFEPPLNKEPSLKRKTGSWRYSRPVVIREKCVNGCQICSIFCPDVAIKKDEEGKALINYDYCKGCGICVEECPRKAIILKEEVL